MYTLIYMENEESFSVVLEKRRKRKLNNLIFHGIVLLSLPMLVVFLAFIVHMENRALRNNSMKENEIVVINKEAKTVYKSEEIASTSTVEVESDLNKDENQKKVVYIDYSDATKAKAVTEQEVNTSDTEEKKEEPQMQQSKIVENKKLNYEMGISLAETLTILNDNEIEKELDDIVSLGIGWVRVDLAWSSVQPNEKGEYLWNKFDKIVNFANERGIKVLPIITYTPHWARSGACKWTNRCAPNDPGEFGEFAGIAAKRYAPNGVHTWEIWNEPNLGLFWKPNADPEYYGKILKEAYEAIHAVDASAIVITGGLAPTNTGGISMSPREFIERLYESGVKEYFDAVGFHPYSFPLSPSQYNKTSAWSQMSDTEWSIRSIMLANEDASKKIWLTEYGAPTGGPGSVASKPARYVWDVPDHVTEGYQSEIFEDAFGKLKTYDWNGPMFWYSYKDLGTAENDKENFFGIIRFDGSKKPVYFKMQDLISKG